MDYEEYYEEEEIISYYDTGLSTIVEGDNESSCSDCSSTLGVPGSSRQGLRPSSTGIPDNICLNSPMANSLKLLSLESPCMSLTSPGMLSRQNTFNLSALISPPLSNRKFQLKSPILPGPPLTLTSYATGEEVVLEDDDEYTYVSYVSCSDTDSHIAGLEELSLPSTDFSMPSPRKDINASCIRPTSPVSSIDFESARSRLHKALESRTIRGKDCVENLDCLRRRLSYELSRKMFKEQMRRSLINCK